MIGGDDLWIAAHAKSAGLTPPPLIARNEVQRQSPCQTTLGTSARLIPTASGGLRIVWFERGVQSRSILPGA